MNAILVLLVLLVINAFAAFYLLSRRREHLRLRAQHEANRQRQQFILGRQDEIGRVLEDASLSVEQVRAQTQALLAEILATDTDGVLMPLVKDNEAWIEEQLAKRQPESGA